MTEYVAGFLLDHKGRVVLVRKNRPDWQAGKLNAVGGHVEEGERPIEAMRREFQEETGLDLDGWEHFATVKGQDWGSVFFYRLTVEPDVLSQVRTVEDEEIVVIYEWDLWEHAHLPNLRWLLPLAQYEHDTYVPVVAEEIAP